ncbi:FxDxF family PEP-CTERM protein [Roseateles toxinivorans]|uniref:Putative secreted protein n=1 Tax=Roseateles toxinivorans TaxID=270368 RepID=A0A4R6QJ88_9BURK|nr:putative secreted protein [Roseateles toxinivorans]
MHRHASHPLLRQTAVAATLALLGSAALAQVTAMDATGAFSMNGGATTNLLSSFPPNSSVDVLQFEGLGTSNVGLHSYGSTSGDFGSRSSGMGVYQVSGGFKLVQTVTNSSAVAQSAKFTFSITPGMVQNDIGSALGTGQYVEAGLKFDVKKGSGSIWDSSATLRSDELGTTASFGGDTSLYAGSGTLYSVLGVTREIDLGVINAGESFELSYELTTFANGVSAAGDDRWVEPTTFTVPEGWYVYGDCGAYGYGYGCGTQPPGTVIDVPGYWVPGMVSGSHASSGDPFEIRFGPDDKFYASISGNPGYGSVSLQPVPEPATYAMLLGGLGVLGWAARRRRRAV